MVKLRWTVAGAEVEERDFILVLRSVGRSVHKRSSWTVGNLGLGENRAEREPKGRNAVMIDKMAGKGELVEDVLLRRLYNKNDAKR